MTLDDRSKYFAFLILSLFVMLSENRLLAETFQLPSRVAAFLANDQNGVTDDGIIVGGGNGGGEFVQYFCAHWRDIVANCASIAPDKRRQNLIAAAAEALPPDDYVNFLNGLSDSIASGKTPSFDIYAITDGVREKQGFLAYNYDNPRVAIVIQKLEALCIARRPNDPDVKKAWGEMKSGQAKIKIAEYMRENGQHMPELLVETRSPAPQANHLPPTTGPNHINSSATPNAEAVSATRPALSAKAGIWPWAIGIVALAGAVLFILKLRR